MASTAPPSRLLADGFPSALEELRQLPLLMEPGLVLGLHGLLHAASMSISYGEADVISGHAAQFLYCREHPDCAGLAFVPPVDTLFRALDVTWQEVTPSGPATAFTVLEHWLGMGRLVLARLKEPLLVYGYQQREPEPQLLAARLRARLIEETIPLSQCDAHYWRYPLDEGNTLISVVQAPKRIDHLTDLTRIAARRAVRFWHTPSLAGCPVGDEAYRRLHADLRDADVDFTDDRYAAWMGPALWSQWTSRHSLSEFFDRAAPRFGGAERKAVAKASFCYLQCVDAWRHFARYLGPTWNFSRVGFNGSYPDDFLARWKNHELRIKGSHWVEEARGWEEKAVTELLRVIK